MPFTSFPILSMWRRSLLFVAIIAGGLFLLSQWYEHSHVWEATQAQLPVGETSPPHADGKWERDITTTPEASEQIDQGMPRSEFVYLSSARHMGLIDHNERFGLLVGDVSESCLPAVAIGRTAG